MEPWEKAHIQKHLPELIECTRCDTKLIAILRSKNILSDDDADSLDATVSAKGKRAQTDHLFQIAKTRINAFKELTRALHATNQTGAYEIFVHGYSSQRLRNPIHDDPQDEILNTNIIFMGTKLPLKQIIDKFPVEVRKSILQTAPASSDIQSNTDSIQINSNIPDPLTYYVNRRLQPRAQLNLALFELQFNDVFVFKLIERSKLTEIANGRSTDTSTNQVNNAKPLTSRFILLEYEEDFAKICELGNAKNQSVHLLEYREQTVYWVRSHHSITNIQHFVLETEQSVSEEEFVLDCLQKPPTQAVCISDTPGMGKTRILANLGRGILKKEPGSVVIYAVLHEFAQKLEKEKRNVERELICEVLAKQGSNSEFGQKILKYCFLLENIQCVVLFDGYDEVLSKQLVTTRKALESILELSSTRVIVTTRPHMREELELLLGVLGHNIQPFQECDQVQFLERFWKERGGCINAKMTEFAQTCLSDLKQQITEFERDFAGIPLQCRLLAEVHCENALKYSNPKSKVALQDLGVSISVTSVFQLYERLMNMRLQQNKNMTEHHVFLAMELLFPEWVEKLNLRPGKSLSEEDVCKVGVLEKKKLSELLRFIHRTVAEFLVAKFVFEIGGNKGPGFGEFWEQSNDSFWQFLMEEVMSAVVHYESILDRHGFAKCKQIKTARYKYPVIAYFVNEFLKNSEMSKAIIKFPTRLSKTYKFKFNDQLSASVCHDFGLLTSSIVDFNENVRRELDNRRHIPQYVSDLLLLCAKHGNKDSFDQLCRLLEPTLKLRSLKFQQSQDPDFMITPLHLAAHFGKYNFVEHMVHLPNRSGYCNLLKTPGRFPYLVHMCVFRSWLERRNVPDKVQIIRLLHRINPKCIEEKLRDGTSPLLQLQVHVDLLHSLIELGVDVNAANKENESILHTVLAMPSGEKHPSITKKEYGRLILDLEKKGHTRFNKRAKGHTPLHLAVTHLDIENGTIESFVRNMADMNALDENQDSVLHLAIQAGRSKRVLMKLIEVGAAVNHANPAGESVLHIDKILANVYANSQLVRSDRKGRSVGAYRIAN